MVEEIGFKLDLFVCKISAVPSLFVPRCSCMMIGWLIKSLISQFRASKVAAGINHNPRWGHVQRQDGNQPKYIHLSGSVCQVAQIWDARFQEEAFGAAPIGNKISSIKHSDLHNTNISSYNPCPYSWPAISVYTSHLIGGTISILTHVLPPHCSYRTD